MNVVNNFISLGYGIPGLVIAIGITQFLTYFDLTFRPNMLASPPRLDKRHSQPIKGKPPEGMKPVPSGIPYLKL